MLEILEAKIRKEDGFNLEDVWSDLYREWQADLTLEEKEIWLWNATVEMLRIKKRRKRA